MRLLTQGQVAACKTVALYPSAHLDHSQIDVEVPGTRARAVEAEDRTTLKGTGKDSLAVSQGTPPG